MKTSVSFKTATVPAAKEPYIMYKDTLGNMVTLIMMAIPYTYFK